MLKNTMKKQVEDIAKALFDSLPDYILNEMNKFGLHIVNDMALKNKTFKDLTGQTQDSYSYAVYYEGVMMSIGNTTSSKNPIRRKFRKGEVQTNFNDVDGVWRDRFEGVIETDGGYGSVSALNFLQSYTPIKKYELVVTTGTEYSVYLERNRDLDVLSDTKLVSSLRFLKSFKPIT